MSNANYISTQRKVLLHMQVHRFSAGSVAILYVFGAEKSTKGLVSVKLPLSWKNNTFPSETGAPITVMINTVLLSCSCSSNLQPEADGMDFCKLVMTEINNTSQETHRCAKLISRSGDLSELCLCELLLNHKYWARTLQRQMHPAGNVHATQ